MDAILRLIGKYCMRIILCPFKLIPIKHNRILLLNNQALNYSDSPKYIIEYLLAHYPGKFEIVLAVDAPVKFTDLGKKGIKTIRFDSLQYFYYMMTTKVFVTNSGGHSYIPKRKQQLFINTHHGGGAYKTNGRDMFEDTWIFRKDLMLASKQTDYFLSTCHRFTKVNVQSILLPKEKFWEIGMPRNDMLLNGNASLRNHVREKLGIREGDKLVLYAPTYRKPDDNYFKESIAVSYGIDCEKVREALHKRFGGNWKFGFRLHPCVVNRNQLPKGNVIDLSDYEDMQELLLAADVMINDFSSSMWDFMLTGKPCFTFALDMDHYVETTKLYTPLNEWPFSKARSNEELAENILNFEEKSYMDACKKHYELLGGCETGKATELVCRKIYDRCFQP